MTYLLAAIFSFIFIPYVSPASQFEIVKDNINVRVDATVTSLSLGYLNKGERLEVIEEKFGWAKVILPPRFNGYAFAQYIKEIAKGKGKVTASALNLRSSPSLTAPILGQVKKGQILKITDRINEWYKVDAYPYLKGWVHMKFLKKADKIEANYFPMHQLENVTLKLEKPNIVEEKTLYNQLIGEGLELIHKRKQ